MIPITELLTHPKLSSKLAEIKGLVKEGKAVWAVETIFGCTKFNLEEANTIIKHFEAEILEEMTVWLLITWKTPLDAKIITEATGEPRLFKTKDEAKSFGKGLREGLKWKPIRLKP